MACGSCRGGRCDKRELAELEMLPLQVECPLCGGDGCERCEGRGVHEFRGCPLSHLSIEEMTVLEHLEAFEHGHLPRAGGLDDQLAVEMDALFFAMTEDGRWKAKEADRNG